ncbi:helix-turn-helix transcriptional regulator [Streptomyces sp. PRKS01-29]|nr:helix-turn-helix transcriptional regulator [Streptomyces sabulosicollis]MBI0294756.1 helix-turn-helix transcriptional regulator [Streptomyces sabulosicollis]
MDTDARLDELLETVRRTPALYLRTDLRRWAELRRWRVPPWTRRIGAEPELFHDLVDTLGQAHDQLIGPYWHQIERVACADRTLRVRHLAEGGVEGLLRRLNPAYVRWRPPVLELTTASGVSGDVHLGGRGLLLIPSLFGTAHSIVNPDADPQPWLTFPLRHDEDLTALPAAATAAALTSVPHCLARLLGRTRATVLCAVADHPGCTTTELARYAAIAPASASEHATVLRGAGLTTLSRHRNTVFHTLAPAGVSLLNASTAAAGG